jgi:ABC-2 type transport system ATP-binding protein
VSVIQASHLTRSFSRRSGRAWQPRRRTRTTVRAVDDVSFAIGPGETVGYIGANGAGKSTTIKMATGILVPTGGTVRTFGLEPVAHRTVVARRLGVVFGQRSQLWWDLPLRDSLELLAAIHRLPPARWRPREAELVERLELGEFLGRPVRQLSLGQRMRGEVAAALLHEPELVVLDEPSVGLDVLSKERLRTFLRTDVAARGATLLLATHDMDDVERLCDRLLVVDHGRLVYDGDIPGLVARVGARRVLVVDLVDPAPPLDAVPQTELVGVEGDGLRQRLAFTPAATTAAAVLAAVSSVAAVRDLSIEEPDIEDVVRRLYLSSGR